MMSMDEMRVVSVTTAARTVAIITADLIRWAPFLGPSCHSLGYDLHYASQTLLPDGGRRIVIATDRPIGSA